MREKPGVRSLLRVLCTASVAAAANCLLFGFLAVSGARTERLREREATRTVVFDLSRPPREVARRKERRSAETVSRKPVLSSLPSFAGEAPRAPLPPLPSLPLPDLPPLALPQVASLPAGELSVAEAQAAVSTPRARPKGPSAASWPKAASALSPGGGKVYSLGEVDEGPVRVVFVKPTYPRSARRRGIEGKVAVTFTVTEEGQVVDPEVISSVGGRAFAGAALSAVRAWRFTPAKVGGKAVSVRCAVTFTFRLEEP